MGLIRPIRGPQGPYKVLKNLSLFLQLMVVWGREARTAWVSCECGIFLATERLLGKPHCSTETSGTLAPRTTEVVLGARVPLGMNWSVEIFDPYRLPIGMPTELPGDMMNGAGEASISSMDSGYPVEGPGRPSWHLPSPACRASRLLSGADRPFPELC